MKKVMLSKRAHAWLNLLLMDETIRQSLMMDQEVAKRITILDDGSVRLDKHKSKFLNWMFNEGSTISFIEVCGIITNILSGHPSNRNGIVLDGLAKGITNNLIDQSEDASESMVDTLFLVYINGYQGEYSSRFINAKANPEDFQDSPRPINNVNYGENGAMIRMTTDDPRSPYVYFPIKDLYMHFKNRML